MKEIKFRAWHMVRASMSNTFTLVEVARFVSGYHEFATSPKGDDMIIMQYTGLKDKNSVDIYEGDILKWTSYKKDTEPYNNVVEFYAGGQSCGFRIRHKSFFKSLTGNGIFNAKAEVVGNIYQTPELLCS